ncbi:hypothetical protein [Amycolatopsis sp. lyj-108]|uniref:hypothetical protein n=1 Tax=Amycolatopsis sp. lyj-108 TaxID=2789286 RepID=UPI0039785986
MTTDFDEHRNALLIRLHESDLQDINSFLAERGLRDEKAVDLVKDLEQDGLVKPLFGSGGIATCRLTGRGEQQAQRLVKERPARRLSVLRQRMLLWLEGHRDILDWTSFLHSDQARYADGDFTWDDIAHEATYLSNKRLIKALAGDQRPDGTLKPRLTSAGRDCVLDHDGDVRSYLAGGPASDGAPTTNYFAPVIHGAVSNSQFASGNAQVTQNQQNTIARAPEQYQELARIVAQLLEQLPEQRDVDEENRQDVETAALDVLAEVTESEDPQRGKVRRATKALSGMLLHLGQAAAAGAAAGTQSGVQDWAQDAINALSNVIF